MAKRQYPARRLVIPMWWTPSVHHGTIIVHMRKTAIVPGEYFHIFNRGNNKQQIFFEKADWSRFMFMILHFQSPLVFLHPIRHVTHFIRYTTFGISAEEMNEIIATRYVELVCFALMPNHFHLLVKELHENGTARYMQRILNAHTKYINAKKNVSGHLFQGPFKAVHVENNDQLLYLSTYIHRNPRELKEWRGKEHLFPWSSYQDYTEKNRWRELLARGIISDQFKNPKEYQHFCHTSPAKENLDNELLIDML